MGKIRSVIPRLNEYESARLEKFKLEYPRLADEFLAETILMFYNNDVVRFVCEPSEFSNECYYDFVVAKRMFCNLLRSFITSSKDDQLGFNELIRNNIATHIKNILRGYGELPVLVACITNSKVAAIYFTPNCPSSSYIYLQDINDFIKKIASGTMRFSILYTFGGNHATIQ